MPGVTGKYCLRSGSLRYNVCWTRTTGVGLDGDPVREKERVGCVPLRLCTSVGSSKILLTPLDMA